MNVHVDPYVDEAEFAEFMAELRLWRKEVRWCVQSLLAEGLRYTIELTAPALGAAFRREAFGLYAVEQTNNAIHGRSRYQIEKGDILVGMNRFNLTMEDLTLAEVTSRVQTLPRPSQLEFVRLRKKASSEAQARLRLIQRQADALDKQRHALRNRAKEYDVTVREDKVIKTHLERQSEILAFVSKKVVWMKRGVNLTREYRLMDKMKVWMTLQLQKPVPTPPKTPISVVQEPPAAAPTIVPPSPRSSGKVKIISLPSTMSSQSSTRNLSWIDDFPSVDLVWLGKEKEKNFNSLLKWFEDALHQDVPLSVAKVLAEQILKALVRHWIDIRNANTSDDAQKLRRSFHDHARQLKANLRANANLRADIVHEVITPEALMTMSKDELASPQIFQQRQELQQSAMRQVIVQPMEGNILIKTRDGFREVPVPVSAAGGATELPDNVKQMLDTLQNAPPPPPKEPKGVAAPKPPPVAPTPPTAQPTARGQPPSQHIPPRPADGVDRQKDATRMKYRDLKHSAKAASPFDPPAKKVFSAPIAVPLSRHGASSAAPLKRHRSIDLATDQSSTKKDGSPLKRVRSTDDSLPTTAKAPPPRPPPTTWKVNAPVVPPPAALAMDMSTSPDLTPSIEVQQTRGLISEIFTNRKALVDNVTKFVQVGNILGQQLVAPDIIAKTETISIAGMGSVVRVHIGRFTVQSSAEKGASMGQVKENGVKAFVEAIDNVRSVFTQVVEKFAANLRRGMDKVAAAQELVQSFPDVVVHDTQPRPKEFICSWVVGKVLVGRHSHKDEHVANVCGWRSFSEFLESMIPKVVRGGGGGDPLAKKPRTDHGPPIMSTPRGALKLPSRAPNTVACFKCSTTHAPGMCPPKSPQSPVACYEAEIMPSKYAR